MDKLLVTSCLEGLRVLNLYAADLEELPISFGKLKHLRYLNVSRTKIKRLPKSIGKLYNLQKLKMQGLYLEEFPKKFQNLVNLRHFYFDQDRMKFPVGIGRLSNLRSLSFFIVGKERGRGVEELGGLENLKGKLSIYNLELVRDYEEAKEARLAEKTKIQKLRFVWEADRSSANNDEDVLDGLQPHSDLESLEICNFLGDKDPLCVTRGRLQELFLRNCQQLTSMPLDAFECCASLESLCISMCGNLESIPSLDSLTRLKRLEIGRFSEELNSFPAFQVISQLKTISLWGWPKLKSLPETVQHLSSLTHLEIHSFGEIDAIPDWLGNPSSLEFLHVELCKNLMYPPSVEALSCLTKLKKPDIWHCPLLSERCNKESGLEWPKNFPIPNINIDVREYEERRDFSTWVEPNSVILHCAVML